MAEKWYAVHRVDDGTLVSAGTEVANPLPDGLAVVQLAKMPDETVEWDPQTRKMKQRPAAPTLDDRLSQDPDYAAMTAAEKRQVRVLARLLGQR